ncbi:hypothetical protein OUZ56_031978 [Daphnia magna]|uniref:Uncharacterized protein n=1 Tax=Daphnia magna TaxID=35525 RepID=A0ABQ9ZWJ7_9CRUS|nr:hypothetical protein OUZ56_031978 [Daphnia magna]
MRVNAPFCPSCHRLIDGFIRLAAKEIPAGTERNTTSDKLHNHLVTSIYFYSLFYEITKKEKKNKRKGMNESHRVLTNSGWGDKSKEHQFLYSFGKTISSKTKS